MSTILKALRRLEQDKQSRALERDLREAVAQPAASPAPRRTVWIRGAVAGGAVAALALLLVAGAGWWLGRGSPDPAMPAVASAPMSPAVAPTDSRPPSREPRVAAARTPDPAPHPDPVARDPVARVDRAPPEVDPIAPVPPPPVRVIPSPPAPAVSSPPDAPPAPSEEPVEVVLEVPRADSPASARVVQLDRAGASSVRVNSTVWHPTAARRSAMIGIEGEGAPRELREGEEIGDFEIIEIKPASVTLSRDGVLVQRGVGER